MQINKFENRTILTLPPSPYSVYSIFNYILSIFLICSIVFVSNYFLPSIITATAAAFVPIALLIFNFKVNVWNIFGVETIVLYSKNITSTLDYKHIYQLKTTEYNTTKKDLKFISSKDGSKLTIDSPELPEHQKSKFRLYFEKKDKKIYHSSNFISYKDLLELKKHL